MHGSRFGSVLLGIGVAVGVAAVIGVVTGFEPSRLPPALLDIAVYKLTFAAAAGLLAAGAIVRRYAKRDEKSSGHESDVIDARDVGRDLPPGQPDLDAAVRRREAERVSARPNRD